MAELRSQYPGNQTRQRLMVMLKNLNRITTGGRDSFADRALV